MSATPKRKVIRDSDDEDDTSPLPPLPTSAFISINVGNLNSTPNPFQHSGEPSTGSTERLSREIQDATEKLLEPTPDATRSTGQRLSSPQQPSSSPAVSKLRRATTHFTERKETKPMKTYGKVSQDDSAVFRRSDSGIERTPLKKGRRTTEIRNIQDQAIDSQVGGVIIGFSPPPVPRGLMNTQDSESSMALTAPENSLLELTVTKASKSSKIVESSDLSRTPPKSRKSRDADNPDEPLLPNGFSVSPKKRRRLEDSNHSVNSSEDQLSMSPQKPPVSTAKPSNVIKPRLKGGDVDDGLDLDEIAIGLPAEQYKPRPSRSRSGQADPSIFVPVDFSKRPETLTKRKKNRRKTTAFERPREDTDEDLILQAGDPTTLYKVATVIADIGTNPLPKAADQHVPEMQNAEPPAKASKRVKKQIQESIEEEDYQAAEAEKLPERSSTRPAGKKRKAPPDPPPLDSTDFEAPDSYDQPNPGTPHRRKIQGGNKADTNFKTPSPSPSTASISRDSILHSPIKSTSLPPPQTPTKAATGPDKHSPLNSSKVAYRVGLSKRARIEPLLRIVRK